jgi:hypothetical protein
MEETKKDFATAGDSSNVGAGSTTASQGQWIDTKQRNSVEAKKVQGAKNEDDRSR